MAVRTEQAGVKNKRRVSPSGALPGQGSAGADKGSRRAPRDDAALLAREKRLAKAKLGPASKATEYERGRTPSTVNGRKKAPSRMHVKGKGGPFKNSRLHGG